MAAQEKLILEAELRNKMSTELKQILKDLNALGSTNPVMKQTTGWFKELTKDSKDFVESGGKAAGVINAFGIGGLTAAASVAGLVAQMKQLGERTLAMKELGREVGLTVDQINAFSHAGAHFGVSQEAMGSALNHLAGQMPEFRRNLGPLMQELGRWPALIKKLQHEGTADQLKDIFEFLGKAEIQREPQLQKKLLGAFFGNGDEMEKLMAQGAKGILGEIDKQQKNLGAISPEVLKQAQAFRDAQIGFNDSLERFETKVGPKFLEMMTKIVDKAAQFFDPDRGATAKKQRAGGAKDERDANTLTDEEREKINRALKTPPKYTPGAAAPDTGLLHHSSFVAGGASAPTASFGLEGTIAVGTKAGFLSAFREIMGIQDLEKQGGGGGFLNASYGPSGGGSGGGGGGAGSGRAAGNFGGSAGVGRWWNKENIEHGIDRLMKEAHLTREGAEGLVSRWATVEAPDGPNSVNPKSRAAGIGQWLGPRKRGFKMGDYDSQLTHAIEELNGAEKAAGDTLRAAKTARDGAVGGSMFERAEGYNPRTGVDNWTAKSEAGNKHIGLMLRGGKLNPDGELIAGGGLPGDAVDRAAKLLGMGSSEAARALGSKMTPGQWCADFVNGALANSKIKGSNSSLANSFLHWGAEVASAAIKKGDVLVRRNGSHVGMAEGGVQMHNGRPWCTC